MANPTQDNNPTPQAQAEVHREPTTDTIVSAARRRVMKGGLVSVAGILTLRAKPLFGNDPNPCDSVSLSAANSRGIDCNQF